MVYNNLFVKICLSGCIVVCVLYIINSVKTLEYRHDMNHFVTRTQTDLVDIFEKKITETLKKKSEPVAQLTVRDRNDVTVFPEGASPFRHGGETNTNKRIPREIKTIVTPEEAKKALLSDVAFFNSRPKHNIPRIIHQIYSGSEIPDVYAPLIQSCARTHPDYQYYLWDDRSARLLVQTHYPKFLPLFDAYCFDLFRSDAIRYFILHHYGGIYLDMDYECRKDVEPLLRDYQFAITKGNFETDALFHNKDDWIMNSYIVSVPRHPFMMFMINHLPSRASCRFNDIKTSTGSALLYYLRKLYNRLTGCTLEQNCFVHALPGKLMQPIWDIQAEKSMRLVCGRKILSRIQTEACENVRKYDFSRVPEIGDEVYAVHRFYHIGNWGRDYKAKRTMNILTIVPRANTPSEGLI